MPKFFFDVPEDGITKPDQEGLELPSSERAHQEAVRATTEMSMDAATTTHPHSVAVAVCDAAHHVICTASVSFDPGSLDE
ncbi:hypothetical protein [Devosia sp.]|uniref:DUF6894 family protein n=1 Tax=Devosia sp. TaxID=1871048 RepID=UPI001B029CA2|nr:hypothetical protein [Devosia sp.]MBO9589466.1 hypothetical protein [Devosia sp.]